MMLSSLDECDRELENWGRQLRPRLAGRKGM